MYTDDQKTAIGLKWAKILQLRKDREHNDRFLTTWGSKTPLGIYHTIKHLVNESNTNLEQDK